MKRTSVKATVGMLAVAGLAVATVGLPSASASGHQWRRPSGIGTWILTITPTDPAIPAFQGIETFAPGGVIVGISSMPRTAPATVQNTGLGV